VDTTEVGPFKKGPFRIAMAVGIPIIPIVIRNAEIVAARNSTVINPGTVDVAVFPPISVQDWTIEALPEHIAEVRQLYLDTLANWPAEELGELPEVDLYAGKKAAKRVKAQPAKTAAKKTATPKKRAKANPNASKVALKDGEAQRPGAQETVSAESPSSPPKGRP
jgi:putative phosphoserine phosphatase / 1-acylglycerol-3-phosphate O-acyltransferase